MWMLSTGIDPEVASDFAAESVVRQHAVDSANERSSRLSLDEFLESECAETADEACVVAVEHVSLFVSRNSDLVGVDDDYIITHFLVRCVGRLFLSTKNRSSLRGNTSKRFAGCVDYVPFAFLFSVFQKNSFHLYIPLIIKVFSSHGCIFQRTEIYGDLKI